MEHHHHEKQIKKTETTLLLCDVYHMNRPLFNLVPYEIFMELFHRYFPSAGVAVLYPDNDMNRYREFVTDIRTRLEEGGVGFTDLREGGIEPNLGGLLHSNVIQQFEDRKKVKRWDDALYKNVKDHFLFVQGLNPLHVTCEFCVTDDAANSRKALALCAQNMLGDRSNSHMSDTNIDPRATSFKIYDVLQRRQTRNEDYKWRNLSMTDKGKLMFMGKVVNFEPVVTKTVKQEGMDSSSAAAAAAGGNLMFMGGKIKQEPGKQEGTDSSPAARDNLTFMGKQIKEEPGKQEGMDSSPAAARGNLMSVGREVKLEPVKLEPVNLMFARKEVKLEPVDKPGNQERVGSSPAAKGNLMFVGKEMKQESEVPSLAKQAVLFRKRIQSEVAKMSAGKRKIEEMNMAAKVASTSSFETTLKRQAVGSTPADARGNLKEIKQEPVTGRPDKQEGLGSSPADGGKLRYEGKEMKQEPVVTELGEQEEVVYSHATRVLYRIRIQSEVAKLMAEEGKMEEMNRQR